MATLSSAMRYATRDPDAHDPDRPSTFDAMRTALVVKDPIHHADIATHPLYGAATPAVGHAWALPRSHPLWRPMDFEVPAETRLDAMGARLDGIETAVTRLTDMLQEIKGVAPVPLITTS